MQTTETKQIVRYYLNGEHIDGWDEVGTDGLTADQIALQASENLTDVKPGDVLRVEIHQDRQIYPVDTAEIVPSEIVRYRCVEPGCTREYHGPAHQAQWHVDVDSDGRTRCDDHSIEN